MARRNVYIALVSLFMLGGEGCAMPAVRTLAVGFFAALAAAAFAQDSAEEAAVSKRRLEFMERTVRSLAVRSDQIADVARLKFAAAPLLRYSDPTRGMTEQNVLVDATVWRLGEQGRPTSLVTLEIYRTSADAAILAYEFASLTESRFSLTGDTRAKIVWDAAGSALTVNKLDGAPDPAKSPAARLTQMRQLSRRFAVQELVKGEAIECRLMPAPIDRYQSAADEIVDGALFAFANGTNPELGIFLECGAKGWTYGTVRLSSAEIIVKLDGREIIRYEKVGDARLRGDYTSRTEPIELPK